MPKKLSEAHIPESLFELGMGNVVVARFKGSGEVECGMFLVDVWCLGVKNAMYKRLHPGQYQEMLDDMEQQAPLKQISVSCARKLVTEAVSYSSRLGFKPHLDFKKAWRVMGGIDPGECDSSYTFGHDGKPHYFQGPHDTLAFSNKVVKTLTKILGSDNFYYTIAGGEDLSDFFAEER